MLYDPKWEADSRSLVGLSLEGFIVWLEQQPRSKRYELSCLQRCVLGQYVRAMGAGSYVSARQERHIIGGNKHDFIIRDEPRTFGAALTRAKAVHAKAAE